MRRIPIWLWWGSPCVFAAVELNEGAYWGGDMTVGQRRHDGGERRHEHGGNLGGIIGIPIVGYLSGEHLWRTGIRPRRGIFSRVCHRVALDRGRAARGCGRESRGMSTRWQFWIDRGGTFTDIVGWRRTAHCIPTSFCRRTRRNTRTPRWEGIRRLLGLAPEESIPAQRVAA